MDAYHLAALTAVLVVLALPVLTLASRIGFAVVAGILCCGLPLWGELLVISGITLVTAALNRVREARSRKRYLDKRIDFLDSLEGSNAD